jgi:hypothetical protein
MQSNETRKEDTIGFFNKDGMTYLDKSFLRPNDLYEMYSKPEFTEFMQLSHVGLTWVPAQWKVRDTRFTEEERVLCSIYGMEQFALVSPVYTQNLYVGIFEEFDIY